MTERRRPRRLGRMLVPALAVILLAAGGVAVGARLWPRVVTIERYVAAPSRYLAPATPAADALPDLIDRLCPAIAAINFTPARGAARQTAGGIVVSADGFIVTVGQDLAEARDIRATLGSGTALDATVSAFDPVSGLALLKIAGDLLPVLVLRDVAFPRIGTSGTALSTGSGQGCSVENGVIGRDFLAAAPTDGAFFEAALATDIGPGTPFVGTEGEVLGLAAAAKADAGPGKTRFIPANMAARLISEMLRTGKAPNARFGVMTTGLDPVLAKRLQANRQRGAMVMFVRPGSSAGKAGIKPGDLIVAADGKPVAGASEFGRAIDPDAATIEIELTRAGTDRTLRLKR